MQRSLAGFCFTSPSYDREFVDLINHLHDELVASRSKGSVESFFGDLFKGISAHFSLDERFMCEHNYDHLPAVPCDLTESSRLQHRSDRRPPG